MSKDKYTKRAREALDQSGLSFIVNQVCLAGIARALEQAALEARIRAFEEFFTDAGFYNVERLLGDARAQLAKLMEDRA